MSKLDINFKVNISTRNGLTDDQIQSINSIVELFQSLLAWEKGADRLKYEGNCDLPKSKVNWYLSATNGENGTQKVSG